MDTRDLYKGSLERLLLQLIERNGKIYGYELMKQAKELSKGNLKITEGTLYPLLHRLESDGVLLSEMKMQDNRIRKYYRLSSEGKKVQSRSLKELQEYIKQLQEFLSPQPAL